MSRFGARPTVICATGYSRARAPLLKPAGTTYSRHRYEEAVLRLKVKRLGRVDLVENRVASRGRSCLRDSQPC